MIGWAIAVFSWVLFWLVEDLLTDTNIFDRYNIELNGWVSWVIWMFLLSGIINLIIYLD